jgi:hypothetical protein
MKLKNEGSIGSALALALSISLGGLASESAAQTQSAKPYIPPMQCPPNQIPTTPERGCIPDRSADFEMGRGKYARQLTLPNAGVNTVAPREAKSDIAPQPRK